MTEEEEDAELLSDAKESERLASITRFETSPWCKFLEENNKFNLNWNFFQMSKVVKCAIIKFVVLIG